MGGEACKNCAGVAWVCEDHQDTPWAGLTGGEECCGGAGAPCPVCSREMACAGLTHPLHDRIKTLLTAVREMRGAMSGLLDRMRGETELYDVLDSPEAGHVFATLTKYAGIGE